MKNHQDWVNNYTIDDLHGELHNTVDAVNESYQNASNKPNDGFRDWFNKPVKQINDCISNVGNYSDCNDRRNCEKCYFK